MHTSAGSLALQVAELLKNCNTLATLANDCAEVGLLPSATNEDGLSKRNRVLTRLEGKSEREIAAVAERVGAKYAKLELEEAALAILESDKPPLTEITRRDVARCFDATSMSGQQSLLDMLRRIWPIDSMGDPFLFGKSLADEIYQHMVRNDDWDVEYLFEKLGAFSCSQKRFFSLLEAAIHPLARRGPEQDELRDSLNAVLARDGFHIEAADYQSGYPTYQVALIRAGVAGKPKNLIFASVGPKPEIGLSDAINNDIVILSNADSCLVYDRPISRAGLLWSELVDWWAEDHCAAGAAEEMVRSELGKRLRASLASDGERSLFDGFFRRFRPKLGATLPALIPQVYLHYDPAVVARLRHRKGLLRQRMDFLLLLPNDARVVIEVDGEHHFAKDGRPSLPAYADMMKADRDLRLLGYDVYRFGANELVGQASGDLVADFFSRLFDRHGVAT